MTNAQVREALAAACAQGARDGWDLSGEGCNAEFITSYMYEAGMSVQNPWGGDVYLDGKPRWEPLTN